MFRNLSRDISRKGGAEFMANHAMISVALRAFVEEVSRLHGAQFRSAVVFGSHARGEDREDSDVDVAVILADMSDSRLDTKLALADIAYDVLLETGVLIQPTPLSEDEWQNPARHPNPRLVENIRREGVPLQKM